MTDRVVIFGDSISVGAWGREGGWVARLRKRLNQDYLEQDGEKVFIENVSRSGYTTDEALEEFRGFPWSDLKSSETTLVLQAGVNDALFDKKRQEHWVSPEKHKENIRHFVEEGVKVSNQIIVLSDPYTFVEGELEWDKNLVLKDEKVSEYSFRKREVSDARESVYIDLREDEKEKWKRRTHDGLHPNTEGHQEIFSRVYKAL